MIFPKVYCICRKDFVVADGVADPGDRARCEISVGQSKFWTQAKWNRLKLQVAHDIGITVTGLNVGDGQADPEWYYD